MAWVVDTSVLLDIRLNDPRFGITSATCLAWRHKDGLVLCPVTSIELAPAFRGEYPLQQAFLRQIGVKRPSRGYRPLRAGCPRSRG